MKRFLIGCALAVFGLVMPLTAMDNCCPSQYEPCCDGMDFNGFYIGGNLGAFTHVAHRYDIDALLFGDRFSWTTNDTTFTAGVQAGYDLQCYNKLFGIVADWNWVDTNRKIESTFRPLLGNFESNSRSDWFTTIRARLGGVICSDTLIYLTGGAVVSRFHIDCRSGPLNSSFDFHRTRWGWTGGVGTEMIVWCNFSIGAEILFMHFNHYIQTVKTIQLPFDLGVSDSAWVGRFLINYRFGDLCSWWCN